MRIWEFNYFKILEKRSNYF